MKSKANVNVYFLLFQEKKILLSLRENTEYEDGKWAPIAGHQEVSESAINALIREAQEEIGIKIKEKNINVSHIMHRKTDRENIDIFFECSQWNGEIKNNEPHKCGGLQFFDADDLPENSMEYTKISIEYSINKIFYSQLGW